MDAKVGHKMDANMGLIRQVWTDAKLGRTPITLQQCKLLLRLITYVNSQLAMLSWDTPCQASSK
uniref:Uncharacterized protein n=1 Tax=Romanomermis culicivorax TaxID=13658 RepID=A0A915J4L3_ROMCU